MKPELLFELTNMIKKSLLQVEPVTFIFTPQGLACSCVEEDTLPKM